MTDFEAVIQAARTAAPAERILLRDPIAAHGVRAIPTMVDWLQDPRLGAFAVRVLGKIAESDRGRAAVRKAVDSVDAAALPEPVAGDLAKAAPRIRGHSRPVPGRGRQAGVQLTEPWPGQRTVSAFELRFHEAMLDIFRLAGEATRRLRPDGTVARGYWASYFLRGVRNHGGPAYARRLLRAQGTTEGFRRLTEERRLDLTMEALVLKPEFAELFTDDDRQVAAHRLAEAGYQPARPAGASR